MIPVNQVVGCFGGASSGNPSHENDYAPLLLAELKTSTVPWWKIFFQAVRMYTGSRALIALAAFLDVTVLCRGGVAKARLPVNRDKQRCKPTRDGV